MPQINLANLETAIEYLERAGLLTVREGRPFLCPAARAMDGETLDQLFSQAAAGLITFRDVGRQVRKAYAGRVN